MANFKRFENLEVQLALADGTRFSEVGKITSIDVESDSQSGVVPFRADFPNPRGQLRQGQTGSVSFHRAVIVIPRQATREINGNRSVFVVDAENVAHQRQIVIGDEFDDDFFIVEQGIDVHDKIVLDGIRKIHDGDQVEYDDPQAEQPAAR